MVIVKRKKEQKPITERQIKHPRTQKEILTTKLTKIEGTTKPCICRKKNKIKNHQRRFKKFSMHLDVKYFIVLVPTLFWKLKVTHSNP